jgi:hypothetical protein
MYDNLSIPANAGVDASQMVVLLRLKPSLGFVLLVFFQHNFIATWQENQLYVSDPKALHHIIVKVLGLCYIHHNLMSLSPKDQYIYEETSAFIEYIVLAIRNWPWHVLISYFKGKSLVFWSWTSGNLGYFLCHFCICIIQVWSIKGDHHRKQRKMLNPVFSMAHMRGMSMYSCLL